MSEEVFVIKVELQSGYKFAAYFDAEGLPPLLMDKAKPIGQGTGPDASRLLAATIGDCLSSCALFYLQKFGITVTAMETSITTSIRRNPQGRLRIADIDVDIKISVPAEQKQRVAGCADLFEDFCKVTQSVRDGIPINVSVDTSAIAA